MAAGHHLLTDIERPQVNLSNGAAIAVLADAPDQHLFPHHQLPQVVTRGLRQSLSVWRTGQLGGINTGQADCFTAGGAACITVMTAINPHRGSSRSRLPPQQQGQEHVAPGPQQACWFR